MDLDTVTDEVCTKLQLLDVDQLNRCCTKLEIIIPPAKLGKKSAIKNLVIKHLTSDAVEDAENTISQLIKMLDEMLVANKDEAEKKRESTSSMNSGIGENSKYGDVIGNLKEFETEHPKQNTTRVEFARLREFKIIGGTLGGAESTLDYRSLCYQVQEARTLNYTSKEIVSGIIKSMKPGSSLRKYAEGKINWSLESIMLMLRSFYDVKESTDLLDEMSSSSQESTEKEMNFVLRMMGYRDTILTLTKEEEYPLGEALVQKKFLHAVSVGFKKDTIRLALAPILKSGKVEDAILMKEVNDVVSRDAENRKKTKGKKKIFLQTK